MLQQPHIEHPREGDAIRPRRPSRPTQACTGQCPRGTRAGSPSGRSRPCPSRGRRWRRSRVSGCNENCRDRHHAAVTPRPSAGACLTRCKPTHLEGVVATDGAGGRSKGVGGAEHGTAGLDGVKALPDHADNGAREHVLDERGEEGLGREVGVVLLEVLLGGSSELEGDELEAALLEAGDDLADEAALDAVGPGVSVKGDGGDTPASKDGQESTYLIMM